MAEITVAVPTFATLADQFTVDIDEPTWPDGSPIEGEITALVGGRPGDWNDAVLGFVIGGGGSTAVPAAELPALTRTVQSKMVAHSPNLPPEE